MLMVVVSTITVFTFCSFVEWKPLHIYIFSNYQCVLCQYSIVIILINCNLPILGHFCLYSDLCFRVFLELLASFLLFNCTYVLHIRTQNIPNPRMYKLIQDYILEGTNVIDCR